MALARLRRMKFGQSSERVAQQADQLELTLEDLEAEQARAECVIEGKLPDQELKVPANRPRRRPLPEHLPRDEVIHAAPATDGCTACGGTMSTLGEDVTEVLEYGSPTCSTASARAIPSTGSTNCCLGSGRHPIWRRKLPKIFGQF